MGRERIEEYLLESLPAWPCFADVEFRSRSACFASVKGSVFLYSADIVASSFVMIWVCCERGLWKVTKL